MVFDCRVRDKAVGVVDVGASCHIEAAIERCQGLMFQAKASLEATKREPLPIMIKTVGAGKKLAGSKGPAVLVVASIQEVLFG